MYYLEHINMDINGMVQVYMVSDNASFEKYFTSDECGNIKFISCPDCKILSKSCTFGAHEICLEFTKKQFNKNFFQCSECLSWYLSDKEHYTIDGKTVCRRCTSVCDTCGERVISNRTYYLHGQCYCNDCLDSMDIIRCSRCGEIELAEEAEYQGWDLDDCLCPDCLSSVYQLHSYHAPRRYTYHSIKDGIRRVVSDEGPYLGFELEIDAEDTYNQAKAIKAVSKFGSFFDCQRDGSLYNGVEIISEPSTAMFHKSLEGRYGTLFNTLLDLGYRSHNTTTCGFHVHIDREWFGDKEDMAIAKMLYIFSKFESEIILFSRRDRREYEQWSAPRYKQKGWIKEAVKDDCGSRYHNINLENSNTIEIRVFKGTLRVETVIATINFVDRICRLCRDTSSTKLANMSWEEILGDDEYIVSYWNTRRER